MFGKQTERREGKAPTTGEFQGIGVPTSYASPFTEPVYRSASVSLSSRERNPLPKTDALWSFSGDSVRSVDSARGHVKDFQSYPSAGLVSDAPKGALPSGIPWESAKNYTSSGLDAWSDQAKPKGVLGESAKSKPGWRHLIILGPLPAYLERYTSFTCFCTVLEVSTAVMASLDHHQIDFEPLASRKRIRAVTFVINSMCKFMISFYQDKSVKAAKTSPSIVVEFQRRNGDVICFSDLYRRVLAWPDLAKLISHESVKDVEPSSSDSKVSFVDFKTGFEPSLQSDFEINFTEPVVLDDPTLSNLVDMACSDDLCTQREATRMLATASSSDSNQKKIVDWISQESVIASLPAGSRNSLFSIMPKLLACADNQILRNSVVILENLSKVTTESFRAQVITYLLPAAVSILESPASLFVLDIQRHVVYSLLSLCQPPTDAFSHNSHRQRVIEALDKKKDSLDVRLQVAVTKALRALDVL